MPRTHQQMNALHDAVQGLVTSITNLVDRLRTAVGSPAGAGEGKRGPGKANPKLKAALKASWARMTPAERKARVTKMLAGRGLKPKGAKGAGAKKRSTKRGASPVEETPVPPSIVI